MININQNFLTLEKNYLFSEIAKRVAAYKQQNPQTKLISLGIGDVTRPLVPKVIEAMAEAIAQQGKSQFFKGYGPEQGYGFLRESICRYYSKKGVGLSSDEVFVSDGAKSDLGNFLDIFERGINVIIPDPVYPAYVDSNKMAGNNIIYAKADKQNAFLPLPPTDVAADIIYICSPNNPTGATYDKKGLEQWVQYALDNDSIIFFDAAYERFIKDEQLPTSIYQIEGAKQCAVEFCSLSKTAGFTGLRCGWTIVPKQLKAKNIALSRAECNSNISSADTRADISLNELWNRRQCTKFNGVPYIVQCGAAAALSDSGLSQIDVNIDYYRVNAQTICKALEAQGVEYYGGKNSPYIWFNCNMNSWQFFDGLLNDYGVVGTTGAGFGANGANYFRLTSFGSHSDTQEAVSRLSQYLQSLKQY